MDLGPGNTTKVPATKVPSYEYLIHEWAVDRRADPSL